MLDLRFEQSLYLISFFLYFIHISVKAQVYHLPNDYFFDVLSQRQLAKVDTEQIHSSIKPYIPFFNKKYEFVPDSYRIFKYISDDPMLDKIFFHHLVHIKSKTQEYEFKIDPLLNIETGRENYDTINSAKIYTNTRGFLASGSIGKKFYFESLFAENQSQFPNYISNFNNKTLIVPGQGRYKVFKTTAFDYAFSSGFISYQIAKKLNIQLGHGKHKIGQGYRSLLLSDNAFNYPYLRLTSEWWNGRLQYSNIYGVLMNLTTGGAATPPNTEHLFQKKAVSYHYLSYNLHKRINVGLFQGMIWTAADSMNRHHIKWQYVNPILFTNLSFYGLNHSNNMLLGLTVNFKLTNQISVYGQFMGDDFTSKSNFKNLFGYQAGIIYYDAFLIKNLTLQTEYNDVTEGAYRNPQGIYTDQSYTHYNQNLAYVLGYGKDFVVLADYKYRRAFFNSKLNLQWITLNQVRLCENTITKFQIGYTINPAYNLNLSIGYQFRKQDYSKLNRLNNETNYFTISLKTSLYNAYYDF